MKIDYGMLDVPFVCDKSVVNSSFFKKEAKECSVRIKCNVKLSWLVLYCFLSKILHKDDLNINISLFGKPYLINYPNLQFNLSHSGDNMIFIFSTKKIGIDIEMVKDVNLNGKEIFFCKDEWSYINSFNHNTSAFFEIWTLKEAYLKYLGIGLNESLKNVNVRVLDRNKYAIYHNEKKLNLNLKSFEFYDKFKYRISICSEKKISSNIINLNEIEWKK